MMPGDFSPEAKMEQKIDLLIFPETGLEE